MCETDPCLDNALLADHSRVFTGAIHAMFELQVWSTGRISYIKSSLQSVPLHSRYAESLCPIFSSFSFLS